MTAPTATKGRQRTFVQALTEALDIAMDRDANVFLLGEDIGKMGGDFGVTRGLFDKYGGERVRDTPLSEAAIVGTCVGAAMVGMRPVAEIMFADFIGECYDQLVNSAAKMRYMFDGQFKAPIVVRTACGAGFGGGPHHSQSVEGWFLNVPGLVIVAPATPADAKGLLLASIEDDNPILFLEHKALYRLKGDVLEGYYTTPLRQAAVAREGKDVTIVAAMKMVSESLAAAEALAKEGIEAEVIDLRTIRPYDAEMVLNSVRKTGRAVAAVEAPKIGGLAAELSATISEECFRDLKSPVVRVAGLDAPIPFSLILEKYILPGTAEIIAGVKQALKEAHKRMAENVILPKWGLTMEEGTVTAWIKEEGDTVTEGETLAEVETDKINNELPSPITGVIAKILVPAGETVPVGTTLVIVAATADEAAQIRSG